MNFKLKTKRLVITPMSDDELRATMESQVDPELKKAYGEMLEGCLAHPQERIFYTALQMRLKTTGEPIGDLDFKGPERNAAVEIGYGIKEAYWNQGYATEAVRAVADWAFGLDQIYFMEAETAPDNAASQRVLEKLSFVRDGEGLEGPRFVLEKPASTFLSIFMCLGMSIGLAIGNLSDNMATYMCLGMLIGLAIGSALDTADRKKRTALKEKRAAAKCPKNSEGDQ